MKKVLEVGREHDEGVLEYKFHDLKG